MCHESVFSVSLTVSDGPVTLIVLLMVLYIVISAVIFVLSTLMFLLKYNQYCIPSSVLVCLYSRHLPSMTKT